jgi:hypothetical protein
MKNIAILILISLVMLTMVSLALIPQMIIPDYDNTITSIRKNAEPAKVSKKDSISTIIGCDSSVYGMDCGIVKYLEQSLTQPVMGGKVFCAYEKIGASERGGITYIDYSCEEFYVSGGKIYRGSGQAGPGKIIVADNGTMSHWIPRDGDYYARDIREFFPIEYRQAAMEPAEEKLAQMNRERGQNYFKAEFDYTVERTTEVVCNYDYECATPGEYMAMSRCPFTSKCIGGKCAIICPNFQDANE